MIRKPLFLLTLILLVAAFLRLYRLAEIPPGFHFDQAYYVFDVVRLLQGQFYIFFAAPGGSEPLFEYLSIVGVALFGDSALGVKFTSAFIGILTVPIIYGFTRTFLRSRLAALVAAALAAISVWLIFYSRDGERVNLEALLALCTLWFFWRAIQSRARRDFVYTGIFLALTLYTYPAARSVPIMLCVMTAYLVLSARAHARTYLVGLATVLVVAAFGWLPLIIYFAQHPADFISHTFEVSVISPSAAEQNVGSRILGNAVRILRMFFIEGDNGLIRNVPGRPVFDPLTAGLLIVGIVITLLALRPPKTDARRLDHKRAAFLVIWIGVALAVSLVSDDAPNFGRLLHAAPALFVVAAWGTLAIANYFRAPRAQRTGAVALVLILAVSGGLAFRDYFFVFGNSPSLYYVFAQDKVEIAEWINRNAASAKIYLAPLVYQHGTVSLLTRNSIFKSFDSRDTLVIPTREGGKDVYYAYPPEQANRVETLAARLGVGEREDLQGSNGAPILLIFKIPAGQLPLAANLIDGGAIAPEYLDARSMDAAEWQRGVQLDGVRIFAEGAGKRRLVVALVMQLRQAVNDDLTFSVKVRAQDGQTLGQEDKMPGSNSYPTSWWSPGEILVERFAPQFDECPPKGAYYLTLEIYDAKTGAVLASDSDHGGGVPLGSVQLQNNCAWGVIQ